MVVLAAAVCTKSGKALISRQFVDISRARIEGLLAAFPKLMATGKQHTFIDTESIRYVYQPLENLYMLIITNKSSNILEDLETLQILAKLVPEYCKSMDEKDVLNKAFELIFAFDEVIALGYKEKVTIHQLNDILRMDSQEEIIYNMVRDNKERIVNEDVKKKIQQMDKIKKTMPSYSPTSGIGGGIRPSESSYQGHGHSSPIEPYVDKKSTSSDEMKFKDAPSKGGMQLKPKETLNQFIAAVSREDEAVARDQSKKKRR